MKEEVCQRRKLLVKEIGIKEDSARRRLSEKKIVGKEESVIERLL